jgi:hypothetical protein
MPVKNAIGGKSACGSARQGGGAYGAGLFGNAATQDGAPGLRESPGMPASQLKYQMVFDDGHRLPSRR